MFGEAPIVPLFEWESDVCFVVLSTCKVIFRNEKNFPLRVIFFLVDFRNGCSERCRNSRKIFKVHEKFFEVRLDEFRVISVKYDVRRGLAQGKRRKTNFYFSSKN